MLGIFLDIETNGLDPFQHEPLEIALVIVDLATGEKRAEYQSTIMVHHDRWTEHDPQSLSVNGFSQSELKDAKEKLAVGQEITHLFDQLKIRRGKSFFICQNPSFDRPFFAKLVSVYQQEEKKWPYHWLDLASMYWARVLVGQQSGTANEVMSVSKDTIAEHLGLSREPHPHRAMNGVMHLIACYEHLIGYPKKKSQG